MIKKKLRQAVGYKGKVVHYLAGASSIMDVAGTLSFKSKKANAAEAIHRDFRAIGGDLCWALRRAKGNVPEQLKLFK